MGDAVSPIGADVLAALAGLGTWQVTAGGALDLDGCARELLGVSGVAPRSLRDALAARVATAEIDALEAEVRDAFASGDGTSPRASRLTVRLDGGGVRALAVRLQRTGERVVGVLRDETEERQRDRSLQESTERLQAALDGSSAGIFRWDIRSDALEWDANLDRLFGLPAGATVRSLDRFVAIVDPRDRDGVVERCKRCAAEGADFEMDFRVTWPDGSLHWLHDKGKTFFDDEGRPSYMTGVCVDVTERVRAAEELSRAHALLAGVLDALPVGVILTDSDGRLVRDNEANRALWGIHPETTSWTQYGAWEGYWPESGHRIQAEEWGLARALLHREVVRAELVQCVRFDSGERRFFLNNAAPIIDEHGSLLGAVAVEVDVTEARSATEALAQRTRELQSLADNSPDVISRFDHEHRHVFVNAAIERVTGRPAAMILGRTNRELGMRSPLCDEWDERIGEVFATAQPRELAFGWQVGASVRHFAAKLVPENDASGRPEFVLAITRDVTDHKRIEQQLRESDRKKDAFLATLAHELRNPLAPIRTGVEVLRRERDADTVARVHATIERQLEYMVRLVDDLLDIARIQQGKIRLKREAVNVTEIVAMAVEGARPVLAARSQRLDVELPSDAPWIVGDPTRLAQVLLNLLTNAAKYSPAESAIELSVTRAQGAVEISVRDAGDGIAREDLEKVFDMFVQVGEGANAGRGGLGIGLALVRELVALHDGRVVAESEGIGRGSTFRVSLPLVEAPSADTVHSSRRAAAPVGRERVLVVDDNVDGAEMLLQALALDGHEVRAVHDGRSALDAVRAWEPAVVLLDIGLPDMDGYEVARAVRSSSDVAQPRLLALTGWGGAEHVAKSRSAGFDGHLTKPVSLVALRHLLHPSPR